MISQTHFHGEPYVGVFFSTNEDYTLIPPTTSEKTKKLIEKTLKTQVVEATIMETYLLGILTVSNSYGFILPHLVTEHEVENIKKETDSKILVLNTKYTVLRNLIILNNSHLIISNVLKREVNEILNFLGMETFLIWEERDQPLIGSMVVVTDKGGVVSPLITSDNEKKLESFLGFALPKCTINSGGNFPSLGLVANSKGGLTSFKTTGYELSLLEKGLSFL